ncbi:3239_t:CDS:1, partial [Paraglomus brasilianum]
VDRLTTGIDIPHLSLLYIDKRIRQLHTLNQTIKRVNRSYPRKTVGVVVDFIGLATNLSSISALIPRRNIGKLAQQELEELESKLPNYKEKEFAGIKLLTEKIIQNPSLRHLLRSKVRKFISFLHHGQEQLNWEQKQKIKNYILLDNNVRNAEEAVNEDK